MGGRFMPQWGQVYQDFSVPGQVAKMMLVAGDMSSQMVQAAGAVVFFSP